MTDTPWLSAAEARAWRAMQTFGAPLAAALNRQLMNDSALSTADYQVLVVLSETDGGVLRAGELGRATGWEKSRLSHHIKRMETRQLVARQDCTTDGRGLLVAITEQGRAAIEDAAPGHVRAVRDYVIDILTPEQLEVLAQAGEAVAVRLTADNCSAAAADATEDLTAADLATQDSSSQDPSTADLGTDGVSTRETLRR